MTKAAQPVARRRAVSKTARSSRRRLPKPAAKVRVRRVSPVRIARVLNRERADLMAGDAELAAAMSLASGLPIGGKQRVAAIRSGMYGNVFSGNTIAARFDAAQTTSDNRNHWAMADGLAADAAANPMVRYVLRNRARYEGSNNCYARGMIETYATDVIGTGPRLQMLMDSDEANDWVEGEFSRWAKAIFLAEKLRTMCKARIQDGEAFDLFIENPGLPTPVKLDLRPIEADQVRFVDISLLLTPSVDGIRFDDFGNPVSYHVLRVHPGYWSYATGFIGMPWEYDVWPAKFVLHWFRQDRPGQHRGLPEMMPALPLFAQLRRYCLATLQAAETAADFAMWMKTQANAEALAGDDGEAVVEVPNPFDQFPLDRNIVTTLPDGYEIGQTKPEQPRTTHEMFVRTILREIARCLNMPYNVIAGDSSDSSYASGRLDHQVYFRTLEDLRKDAEIRILDRLLAEFLRYATDVRLGRGDFGQPYIPVAVRDAMGPGILTGNAVDLPSHTWHWVGHEYGNRQQEANATDTSLRNGSTTYAIEYAKKGIDYRKAHMAQAKALGITLEQFQALLRTVLYSPRGLPAPGAEQQTDESGKPAERRQAVAVGVEEDEQEAG